MRERADTLTEIIDLVRPVYKALEGAVQAGLAETGLGITERAILDQIHRKGPQTVPQIGRSLIAPRQFIQKTANALMTRDLLTTTANAAHRRSRLLVLTDTGQDLIAGVLAAEATLIADVAKKLDPEDLVRTRTTLAVMVAAFTQGQEPDR